MEASKPQHQHQQQQQEEEEEEEEEEQEHTQRSSGRLWRERPGCIQQSRRVPSKQAHRRSHPNASCVFDTMRRNMLRYTWLAAQHLHHGRTLIFHLHVVVVGRTLAFHLHVVVVVQLHAVPSVRGGP